MKKIVVIIIVLGGLVYLHKKISSGRLFDGMDEIKPDPKAIQENKKRQEKLGNEAKERNARIEPLTKIPLAPGNTRIVIFNKLSEPVTIYLVDQESKQEWKYAASAGGTSHYDVKAGFYDVFFTTPDSQRRIPFQGLGWLADGTITELRTFETDRIGREKPK